MRPLKTDLGPLVISGSEITKRYSGKPVFRPVSFEARSGDVVAITGPNGAGKSTLLKMVSQVMTPTKGELLWARGSVRLDHASARHVFGFAAPYLELYAELTAVEHIRLVAELKAFKMAVEEPFNLLKRFGLDQAIAKSDRRVGAYSSGMKQRVRCAMAFSCLPEVLLLDEVTSNLDEEGTANVLLEVKAVARAGAIVFIATNDPRERQLATKEVRLEPWSS